MPGTLVFVPMYRCERQIPRVLARLTGPIAPLIDHVLVVDNRSPDGSVAAATAALGRLPHAATLLVNDRNVNLGGSHKVAFRYALDHGYDHVLVLHGDDQADPDDAAPWLAAGAQRPLDALLGSRFMAGARRSGYSWHRTWGNRGFNLLFSVASGRRVLDLGSGLNVFATAWLREPCWWNLADDLTFNVHLLLRLAERRARIAFAPISWREEDQVSNVRLFRQARRTLGMAVGYSVRGGAYLDRPHTALTPADYTSQAVFRQVADAGRRP